MYIRAMNIVNTSETRRIVDDLTSKYPCGPSGRLPAGWYETIQQYSEHYHRYMSVVVLKKEAVGHFGITELTVKHFGYEPLDLFRLGIRNEDDAVVLVRSLHPGLSRPGVTRKSRLLWSRVRRAVSHMMKEGTEGIWSVSSHAAPKDNIWRNMKIWGANKADVEAQVRLIGPMTGLMSEWHLNIDFHDLGTPEDATQHAMDVANGRVNKIKADIKSYREYLKKLEVQLEEELSKAAKSMGGIMLLSGGEEDNEKEAAQ